MAYSSIVLMTNNLETVRDCLNTELVTNRQFYKSVTYQAASGNDPATITFTDNDDNDVAVITSGTTLVEAHVDGQADTVISWTPANMYIGGAVYCTDNAVALYCAGSSSDTWSYERLIIFTKNNLNKNMVIVSTVSSYYAWSYDDTAAPTGISISTVSGKDQNVLVPFTSSGGLNHIKYSPNAYWCHETVAYTDSAPIKRPLIKMEDQDNNLYMSNGIWVLK